MCALHVLPHPAWRGISDPVFMISCGLSENGAVGEKTCKNEVSWISSPSLHMFVCWAHVILSFGWLGDGVRVGMEVDLSSCAATGSSPPEGWERACHCALATCPPALMQSLSLESLGAAPGCCSPPPPGCCSPPPPKKQKIVGRDRGTATLLLWVLWLPPYCWKLGGWMALPSFHPLWCYDDNIYIKTC